MATFESVPLFTVDNARAHIDAAAALPLAADGLSANATRLAPDYAGEDRNASPREKTVTHTMGWSQRAADMVIAHAPDADGSTDYGEGLLGAEPGEQLTGAERTRRHLAALGMSPTNSISRPAAAWRNHVDMYSR